MYIAFHHFKHGKQLPTLPNEICEMIRNKVDWEFCHTCGKKVTNHTQKIISIGYSIVQGYTVCVDCKKTRTLCQDCDFFNKKHFFTNNLKKGVLIN